MTRESTDDTRPILEDIPDDLGLDEFDTEPYSTESPGRSPEYRSVANPATGGAPTYHVLSPSDPVAIAASIETRWPVRLSLGQRALDRVGTVVLVAIDRGRAVASRRPISIDQSAVVAIALAVAVVGYGALYVAVWNRPAPAESTVATRSVHTADVAPVVAPRPVVPIETTVRATRLERPPAPKPEPRPASRATARAAAPPARAVPSRPTPPAPTRNAVVSPPSRVVPLAKVEAAAVVPPPSEFRRPDAEVAVAPVVAPTPPPAPAATATLPSRTEVDDVLAAYRHSYNTLDAASVVRVWDGADRKALQRAFSSLKRQRVAFDSCDIDVTSATRALAHCVGVLSYVPKYGSASEQRRSMEWTIYLQQHDSGWMIASVAARAAS
jgi:hypothetical protein